MAKFQGRNCAASWCTNKRSVSNLSFFRFPKDPERCKQWVLFAKRHDLASKSPEEMYYSYRLCSKHFDRSQFRSFSGKTMLNSNACPHIIGLKNPPSPKKRNPGKEFTEQSKTQCFLSNNHQKNKTSNMMESSYTYGRMKFGKTYNRKGNTSELTLHNAGIYNIGENVPSLQTSSSESLLSLNTSSQIIEQHYDKNIPISSVQNANAPYFVSNPYMPSPDRSCQPVECFSNETLNIPTSQASNLLLMDPSSLKSESNEQVSIDLPFYSSSAGVSYLSADKTKTSSNQPEKKEPLKICLPQHIMNALCGPTNSKCIVLSSRVAQSLKLVTDVKQGDMLAKSKKTYSTFQHTSTTNMPQNSEEPSVTQSDTVSSGKQSSMESKEVKPLEQFLSTDLLVNNESSVSTTNSNVSQPAYSTVISEEMDEKAFPQLTVSINPTDIYPEGVDRDSDVEYEEILGI